MLDRGIKYFNGIVAEIEAQQGADKTIPADKVRGSQGGTASLWVVGHDNVVLKLVVTRTMSWVSLIPSGCVVGRRSTCTTRWASPWT